MQSESSLTTPEDRNLASKWRPDLTSAPLTVEEGTEAFSSLNIRSFTDKFPAKDRTYSDPPLPMQTYGLLSFVPAKGATPNESGIFGFAKMRGNFATEMEADQRAEYLIRNVDSYHTIYHTYVGRPFPMTNSSKYSADTSEIDIRKAVAETVSQSVKEKRQEEVKVMNEIREREEKLVETTKAESEDPYELYITLRVKKAQLSWTYVEHTKKLAEIRDIIIKTRAEVEESDLKYPDFKETYYQKYMKARVDAGLNESREESLDNFIKYIVEDIKLDGIDV